MPQSGKKEAEQNSYGLEMTMQEGPGFADFNRTIDMSWVSANKELKCREGVSVPTWNHSPMTAGGMETLKPTSSPTFDLCSANTFGEWDSPKLFLLCFLEFYTIYNIPDKQKIEIDFLHNNQVKSQGCF